MIKHIVMWNIRGDTPLAKAAAIDKLKCSFDELRSLIPGIVHMEIGVDSSRIDYACDVVLYSAYCPPPGRLRGNDELKNERR